MVRTIHKFHLTGRKTVLELPEGTEALKLGQQNGLVTLWCLVEKPPFVSPKVKLRKIAFSVYGTGWELPDDPGTFMDTVFIDEFVWHVFCKSID